MRAAPLPTEKLGSEIHPRGVYYLQIVLIACYTVELRKAKGFVNRLLENTLTPKIATLITVEIGTRFLVRSSGKVTWFPDVVPALPV